MISTVISSTVVTGFGMVLGVVAVIALVAFLGIRELATARGGSRSRFLARSLDIGIVPLIIVFAVIVVMAVVNIIA